MNTIVKLIDERVQAALLDADFISIAPCKVLALQTNNYVRVEMISDKRVFTVKNLSGSLVEVGDEVKLAYRGYISNSTSYVVAAQSKHSADLEFTASEDLADSSVIQIRMTDNAILVAFQITAESAISADTAIATVANVYPFPVGSISGSYYGVLRNLSDSAVYDIEAKFEDNTLHTGKLSFILHNAIGQGDTLVGQVFCLLPA